MSSISSNSFVVVVFFCCFFVLFAGMSLSCRNRKHEFHLPSRNCGSSAVQSRTKGRVFTKTEVLFISSIFFYYCL